MTVHPPLTESVTRILIVDDHELMRTGLRDLIQSQAGWTVCGEATNEIDAVQGFENTVPDLLVVDLNLKDSQGLNVIRRIKQMHPTARILVLTMHDENLYAERCLRAGAQGFIDKQEPSREILRAMRTVLEGEVYVSETMGNQLLHRIIGDKSESKTAPMERLSDRELEIFCLIGRGLKTEDIARQLHLSTNTIGTYRERLKTKLKAKSSAELTRLALNWVSENG